MLFRRDFGGYTGGHGKVHDYFRHTLAHPDWSARVYMDPSSTWDDNPWRDDRAALCAHFDPRDASALFLGGMDWLHYPDDLPETPVVNLIQHVRHADPDHPLFQFLDRRAVRICVSQPVADALLASGRVRGPVEVIEAALNLPPPPTATRRSGIFIDALKRPEMGREIAATLSDRPHVVLSDRRMPRAEYLGALAAAEIAVVLPHDTEGFYLPALEAMAAGCAVVVADCIGNRAYLQPDRNALVAQDADGYAAAVRRLAADAPLRNRLAEAGRQTADGFGLARERAAFHSVLDRLDALWSQA